MLRSIYANIIESRALLFGALFKGYARIRFSGRFTVGRRLRIFGPFPFVRVGAHGRISIGDGCTFVNSTKYNNVGVIKPVSLVARDGLISIGDYVGMSGVSIFSDAKITIGDYAVIGANAFIFDTDFHDLDPVGRRHESMGHGVDRLRVRTKPVGIGTDVFIGLGVVICKGVSIGDRATVGAGAVVRRDVPSESICIVAENKLIEPRK